MRAVVQRVQSAGVTVGGETAGAIGAGLLVYLGISSEDTEQELQYICEKLLHLRIFDDENDVPNRSVLEVGGSILLVSQFTLYGDARKGRRPGYSAAARPEDARRVYDAAVRYLAEHIHVETGIFQAHMLVESVNDGPFTILLDSGRQF